jgi:hypothetical protein
MSGYRRWYLLTVLRWDSPKSAATPWASMRSANSTDFATGQGYTR